MSKLEPSMITEPLHEAPRAAGAGLLRAKGFGRPGARPRITPNASGVTLEVFAPLLPAGEPGLLDA